MTAYLPDSLERWGAAALLCLGGLFGFVVHPLTALVFWLDPFGWCAHLLMTAAQESGFNASNTTGDEGESWGIVQFHSSTWPSLTGMDLAARTNPFLSGFFAARYVQIGLLNSPRWWLLALPGYGAVALRWMWTHGNSASSAESLFSGDGDTYTSALDQFTTESKPLGAFVLWRLVTLPLSLFGLLVLLAMRLRRSR